MLPTAWMEVLVAFDEVDACVVHSSTGHFADWAKENCLMFSFDETVDPFSSDPVLGRCGFGGGSAGLVSRVREGPGSLLCATTTPWCLISDNDVKTACKDCSQLFADAVTGGITAETSNSGGQGKGPWNGPVLLMKPTCVDVCGPRVRGQAGGGGSRVARIRGSGEEDWRHPKPDFLGAKLDGHRHGGSKHDVPAMPLARKNLSRRCPWQQRWFSQVCLQTSGSRSLGSWLES